MAAAADYRDRRDELERIFKSMPTYKDGYISTTDFGSVIKEMKYGRTNEQVQGYVDYWDKHHEGKLQIETFMSHATSLYKTSEFARQYAIAADSDNNGFISSDEFVGIVTLMCIHDPELVGKSYSEFVDEADTNKDGKVSIEECASWIENQLNK